jgi:spermidine synthase
MAIDGGSDRGADQMTDWMNETDLVHGQSWRVQLKMERVLYEGRSRFQNAVVFDNRFYGRVLALDGIVQTTEADEFFYHEALVHTPLFAHGRVRRVLIIGGGDGGALEEVLKHPGIESVTLVEIDQMVIDLAKRYLTKICGRAFEDPRLKLVIGDGVDFVTNCRDSFDVILIDSTDPTGIAQDNSDGDILAGPGLVLFGAAFYGACKALLEPGGLLVTQNAVPFVETAVLAIPVKNLRVHFAQVACYRATVPSFYGGEMVFNWASDDRDLGRVPLETLKARFREAGIETRYYTPEVHLGAFALPPYLAELMA